MELLGSSFWGLSYGILWALVVIQLIDSIQLRNKLRCLDRACKVLEQRLSEATTVNVNQAERLDNLAARFTAPQVSVHRHFYEDYQESSSVVPIPAPLPAPRALPPTNPTGNGRRIIVTD